MTESTRFQPDGHGADAPTARRAACKIVGVLREAGHVAYLAGGCVRDELLGAQPKDFDVATDAEPGRVIDIFRVTRAVGEAFGVVMVRLYGAWVEVATFRTDGVYEDGRHPTGVAFTDAEHDAQRRDFTINGMYFDPVGEQVIDYVGGRADLAAGVIRAIGDPHERFGEDYLRMLRAVRFAARLGFVIDDETGEAIREHASKLSRISRERIGMELAVMLGRSGDAAAVVGLLQDLQLTDAVLCEEGVGVSSSLEIVNALGADADYVTALAAWALDRHLAVNSDATMEELGAGLRLIKPVQIARRWRTALMLSNKHRDGLAAALGALKDVSAWFDLPVAKRKRLLARRDWARLDRLTRAMKVKLADGAFDWAGFDADIATLRESGVSPPALLDGDALVAAGMPPGPRFKDILHDVYDAQLEGRVKTKEEALALAHRVAERG